MKASLQKSHPYHWQKDKHAGHRFLDIVIPLGLLFIYYWFYNKGILSGTEAVKTSGLWAISLLSLTLVIGPLSRVFPIIEHLKAHRKVWGVTSFWAAVAHVLLVIHFYWKWDLSRLWDITNPKYTGVVTGLLALCILGLVTWTSKKSVIAKTDPRVWKIIQTTSYLALSLAVLHFFYMEQKDGVLVIKRLLGQITFYFSILVLAARLLIVLLPSRNKTN